MAHFEDDDDALLDAIKRRRKETRPRTTSIIQKPFNAFEFSAATIELGDADDVAPPRIPVPPRTAFSDTELKKPSPDPTRGRGKTSIPSGFGVGQEGPIGKGAARIGTAFEQGFEGVRKSFGHFGMSKNTEEFFSALILPAEGDAPGVTAAKRLNRSALGGAVVALEMSMAGFVGVINALSQTAVEFGMNEHSRDGLTRLLVNMVVSRAGLGRPATRAELLSKAAQQVPLPKRAAAMAKMAEQEVAFSEKIGKTIADDAGAAMDTASGSTIFEFFDFLRPVKRVEELAVESVKATGEVFEPGLSPYKLFRLLAGTRGVVKEVFERGTPRRLKNGDLVFDGGEGLRAVFTDAMKADKLPQTLLYMTAKRAADNMRRGKERNFTRDEIASVIKKYRNDPVVRDAQVRYNAFNRRLLDFAEQNGLVNAQSKADLIRLGQNYVPFYRLAMEEGVREGGRFGSVFKRLKEGTSNLNEVMANIEANTAMIVHASLQNYAKQQLYGLIDKYGLSEVATKMKRKPVEAELADKRIIEMLEEMGDTADPKTVRVFDYNQELAPRVDMVFRDGRPEYYQISPMADVLHKSMMEFAPRDFNATMRVFQLFKTVLTRSVTAMPDFMIANGIRDMQMAFAQSKANQIPGISFIRGLGSRIFKDQNYHDAMLNGAGFATTFKGEMSQMAEAGSVRAFYKGRLGNKFLKTNRLVTTAEQLINVLEEVTSAVEMASRLEENRLVTNKTGSRVEGAFSAREVSTDFAMRGAEENFRAFLTTLPFANAAMQGLYRFAREGKEHPTRLAAKGMLAVTLPTLALWRHNQDDPDYWALPDYVRDMNWVIKVPGSSGFAILPRGFEFGAMFATIPERMIEAWDQKYGKAFSRAMGDIVLDQMRLNPIPQLVRPIVEQVANIKTFPAGQPVVPEHLRRSRIGSEQRRPWTNETMVELSKAMSEELGVEWSPMRSEALVRGYFATVGFYLMEGADAMMRAQTGNTRPERRLDENPIVRRFFRSLPLKSTQYEIDLYEIGDVAQQLAGTLNNAVRLGQTEVAERVSVGDRREALLQTQGPVNQIVQEVSRQRANQRLIAESDLSPKEKRKQVDAISTQVNKMTSQFYNSLPERTLRLLGKRVVQPSGRRGAGQ